MVTRTWDSSKANAFDAFFNSGLDSRGTGDVPTQLIIGGGALLFANGEPREIVGHWNSASQEWEPLGLPGVVHIPAAAADDLHTYNSTLLASGTINSFENITAWDADTELWSDYTDATLGDVVTAMADGIEDSDLYASTTGGTEMLYQRDSGTGAWAALTIPSGGSNVLALAGYSGDSHMYVGGSFTGVTTSDKISRWRAGTWRSVGGIDPNGDVSTLLEFGGDMIVGGAFTSIGGSPFVRIAAWDTSSYSALGSGLDSTPDDMVIYDGDLVVVGSFTSAGGVSDTRGVGVWDGSVWSSIGGLDAGNLTAATVYKGDLVVTGTGFTTIGGSSATRVARWNGSTWTGMGAGLNTGGTTIHTTTAIV